MSEFFHGARAKLKIEKTFSVQAAASGIVFAVGTAPVNQVGTYPDIVCASSFDEAKAALGYSDNWEQFTLCEVMHTQFKKYGVGPVFLVNVADPSLEANRTNVEAKEYAVTDTLVELPETAIANSIVVTNNDDTLEENVDYEVYFDSGKCYVAAVPGGAMEGLEKVKIAYESFTFDKDSMVEKVIGGYDTATGISSGIELADECYAMYQVNPDLLIAPGFSHIPEVANALNAKAMVNTLFRAMAVLDADCQENTTYTAAVAWKQQQRMGEPTEILCWPMVKDDEHQYHMSSHVAAMMAVVDGGNDDCPSESMSNKAMKVTGTVLADGTEVKINLSKANYLNANGIVTAMNFIGGFRAWGNYTCAYPDSTDSVEVFIPVRRMFNWVANSAILTYWEFVDKKLTRRLCESISDSMTKWLNSLTAAGHLYGGRVEFLTEENTDEDIMAGVIRPHLYLAPPAPAQEISFILEYDAQYVSSVLSSS